MKMYSLNFGFQNRSDFTFLYSLDISNIGRRKKGLVTFHSFTEVTFPVKKKKKSQETTVDMSLILKQILHFWHLLTVQPHQSSLNFQQTTTHHFNNRLTLPALRKLLKRKEKNKTDRMFSS